MATMISMDLRTRLVAAVNAGWSCRAAAARFGVSASCAIKLLARVRLTGSTAPGRRGRLPGGGKLAPFKSTLIGWVEEQPDITMPELAARLRREHGVSADPSALSRLLCQAGWTFKKSPGRAGGRACRRRQKTPPLVPLVAALAVPASRQPGVHR